MFKLLIALFLVTNGTPADKPSKIIQLKEPFKSEQACKDYYDTATQDLEEMGKPKNLAAKFACVETEEAEDNTI